MSLRKHAVTFAAVLTLVGTAAIPAGAFQAPSNQTQPINAEFVPTQQEVQTELASLRERIDDAEKSSFYSPEASNEYLDAQRYYKFGRYDEALDDAHVAEKALPPIPNWQSPDNASR
jgi:hypothetical protein